MTRTVNIEVYCDNSPEGGKDVFGVASEHRPDLPKPFDEPMQKWVNENFNHLDVGESIESAGELVYEPNGEIVEFRMKE